MSVRRLQRQEGLARQALVIFIAVAALFVVLLDSFGVFSAWQTVRGDASDASQAGLQSLVVSSDAQLAHQAAASTLREDGATMTSFTISGWPGGNPAVTVGARHEAKTYVLKYAVHLPFVGKMIKHLLRAHATRTTSNTNY